MTSDELRRLLVAPEIVVVDLLDHGLEALRLAMLARLDEKLFLEVFAQPPKTKTTTQVARKR